MRHDTTSRACAASKSQLVTSPVVVNRQQGQSVVEMALMLPVLIILLMGIIMAGFTFYGFIQVSNAAREGARAGSLYRITQTESGLSLNQTVKRAIYYSSAGTTTSALGHLDPTSPSFDIDSDVDVVLLDLDSDGEASSGDQLSVTVTYRYTLPIVSDVLPVFPQPMVIARTVTMVMQ